MGVTKANTCGQIIKRCFYSLHEHPNLEPKFTDMSMATCEPQKCRIVVGSVTVGLIDEGPAGVRIYISLKSTRAPPMKC